MKWEAALNDKKIETNQADEEEQTTSPDQELAMDKALQAAMIRKRLEAERGRSSHQN